MIPVGARVGIGALVAALLTTGGLLSPATLVAVAAAATAIVALLGAGPGRHDRARTAGAVLIGAWLLAVRVLAGGGAAPDPPGALPEGGGPWVARVTALGTPREGTQRFTVALGDSPGTTLAVTAPRFPDVEPGDSVRLDGRPASPPLGGYGDFLRRTGVAGTLRSAGLAVLGKAGDPAGMLERIRRAAGDALARALPEPAAGLAAGILVGLRDRVDRDLAAAFTATGLSHVVAISGWNIALVAGLVAALLAGRARRTRSVAILVAIVVYTILAGASASVVRAAAMAGVALLARETGRPGTAAAALGWAVAILVLVAPANANDVGLQLSAAATAGLIAWSAPIGKAIERRAGWLPGWIREGLGVSLAAQAATLPIVLLAFGRVAPMSPLTNLAVVPLVPLAMATGTLALAGGALAAVGAPGIVATLAGIPGAIVLGLLIAIVRLAAVLPLASLTLPPAAAALAAGLLVVGLAAVVFRRRIGAVLGPHGPSAVRGRNAGPVSQPGPGQEAGHRASRTSQPRSPRGAGPAAPQAHGKAATLGRRPARLLRAAVLLAGLALAVLVLAAATRPDGRAHVVILDVGQGDAILVVGPTGGRMLVDGGPDPDRLLVALDARLPPWDRRIDLVLLTHPHEDHVAGLPLILERYRVGRVVEPGMPGRGPGYEAFDAGLAALGMASARLATGDRLVLDGIALDVLWPDADRVPAQASEDGSTVNDSSIVLLGTFQGRRFLLTGDAEADVEAILLARGLPSVDLLKAGHHGSRTSTSEGLVEAARPRVAAISVGARNDYGHPSREVLARLEAAGATVLRTDQLGAIDVALSADAVTVRTDRQPPEPRSAEPRPPEPQPTARGIVHGAATLPAATLPAATLPAATSPAAAPPRRPRTGDAARLSYDRRHVRPFPRGRRRPPPRARRARATRTSRTSRASRRRARGPPRCTTRRPRACGRRAREARARCPHARRHGGRGVTGAALGYYWGDDEYGLEAAAESLGRRAAGPDGEPLLAWRTTGAGTRAGEIAERVATATLFGGGTLVIVEDPGPLVRAKAERDALMAAVAAVAPGNALAFVEPTDGSARRPKSLEDLAAAIGEAGGEVRQVTAPREGGMARWIEERAAERSVRLERGAAEALARKVGAFVREGDVDRRRQGRLAVAELAKLAVYRLDAGVRAEDVDALVADAIPGSTWAFLDAVGSRKGRDAADLLERLLDTTPEPVLVAVLHRRIRDLLLVADHRERGETIQATARALKLKEFPARKLWEQGTAWRQDELVGALEGLLELDATLKGEGAPDVRRRRLAFLLWIAERVARA